MEEAATMKIKIEFDLPDTHPLADAPVLVVGNDDGELVVQRDEHGVFVVIDDWTELFTHLKEER